MGGGKAIAQLGCDAMARQNEPSADQERGMSRFGRVYKRRGCNTCGNCDGHHHHGGEVDALGEKLSAALTLAPPLAPIAAAAVVAPVEEPVAEEPAPVVDAPAEKEAPAAAARSRRGAPRGKLSQEGKEKAVIGRSPLASKAGKNNSSVVNKADVEPTAAPKKGRAAHGIPVKKPVVEDGKENRSRASTRKQRSLKEIHSQP